MPTLEIIQITNGETKVLRTAKSYPELYKAYRRMQDDGAFVRMRRIGRAKSIWQRSQSVSIFSNFQGNSGGGE